jgi:uncharacterized membrane protein YphA (DoxX/SURF4 family)
MSLKLPLAFIAAVFGMNNPQLAPEVLHDLNMPAMSLRDQLKLMCKSPKVLVTSAIRRHANNTAYLVTISSGIITLVLVLAFSTFTRAAVASVYYRVAWWFVTRFWIYRIWIRFRQRWASESQWRHTEAYIAWQKAEEGMAKRRRFGRTLDGEWELKRERQRRRMENRKKKPSEGVVLNGKCNGMNGSGSKGMRGKEGQAVPIPGGDLIGSNGLRKTALAQPAPEELGAAPDGTANGGTSIIRQVGRTVSFARSGNRVTDEERGDAA